MKLEDFMAQYPNAQIANGVSELGYDNKVAILANWNQIPNEVYEELESDGYSCEWEDEWISCDECGKIFRTSPDSYSWEMFGIIDESQGVICGECIDIPAYLESIENNPKVALTSSLLYRHKPIEAYGYKLVARDYENGLYEGQNDNPKEILAKLIDKTPSGRFIFVIDSQGQFDISFSVYQRVEELSE